MELARAMDGPSEAHAVPHPPPLVAAQQRVATMWHDAGQSWGEFKKVVGGMTVNRAWNLWMDFESTYKTPEEKRTPWAQIRDNLRSGITVALVNVPLSISLAVAADSTPMAGVVTTIWAGLSSAVVGGSHFNIVGPTGALSGVLAKYNIRFGEAVSSVLAVYAGLLSLAVYVFGVQKYVLFLPESVVQGFTLGVAVIIALNQLTNAFGLMHLPRHEHFVENVSEVFLHLGEMQVASFILFVIGFVALLLLARWRGKLPWTILLAIIGIIMGALESAGHLGGISIYTLEDKFGSLEPAIVEKVEFDREMLTDEDVISASFSVAFIAVLETLISARVADSLTRTKFNERREVLGVAVANVLSGVFGGLPATAALARTSLNLKNGATSRLSAIINIVVVLIITFALLTYFRFLPLSVIAAMVCVVAVRMVEVSVLKHMFRHDKPAFAMAIFVAATCVIFDPTMGIIFGAVGSLLLLANDQSFAQAEVVVRLAGQHPSPPHSLRVVSYFDAQMYDRSVHQITRAVNLGLEIPDVRPIQDDVEEAGGRGGAVDDGRELGKTPGLTPRDSPVSTPEVRHWDHNALVRVTHAFLDHATSVAPHAVPTSTTVIERIRHILRHRGHHHAPAGTAAAAAAHVRPPSPVIEFVYEAEGGPITYLNANSHRIRMRRLLTELVPVAQAVRLAWVFVLDLHQVTSFDLDGSDAIDNVVQHFEEIRASLEAAHASKEHPPYGTTGSGATTGAAAPTTSTGAAVLTSGAAPLVGAAASEAVPQMTPLIDSASSDVMKASLVVGAAEGPRRAASKGKQGTRHGAAAAGGSPSGSSMDGSPRRTPGSGMNGSGSEGGGSSSDEEDEEEPERMVEMTAYSMTPGHAMGRHPSFSNPDTSISVDVTADLLEGQVNKGVRPGEHASSSSSSSSSSSLTTTQRVRHPAQLIIIAAPSYKWNRMVRESHWFTSLHTQGRVFFSHRDAADFVHHGQFHGVPNMIRVPGLGMQ